MLNTSVSKDSELSKLGSAKHCHTSNQAKGNELYSLNDLRETTQQFLPHIRIFCVNSMNNSCFSIGLKNTNFKLC